MTALRMRELARRGAIVDGRLMRPARLPLLFFPPLVVGLLHCGSSHEAASIDGGSTGNADRVAPPEDDAGRASDGASSDGAVDGGGGNPDDAAAATDGGAAQGTTVGFFVGVNALITDSPVA
jgi:hypothetical protein